MEEEEGALVCLTRETNQMHETHLEGKLPTEKSKDHVHGSQIHSVLFFSALSYFEQLTWAQPAAASKAARGTTLSFPPYH